MNEWRILYGGEINVRKMEGATEPADVSVLQIDRKHLEKCIVEKGG